MRSVYCGQLNVSHIGSEVTLCGWVDRIRNLGKLIFVDLRDREGIIQVVFDSSLYRKIFHLADELRNEFCLQIVGVVRNRPNVCFTITEKDIVKNIEVLAKDLVILNRSKPLPLDFHQNNSEEQRLKYRYLDLRRLSMMKILKIRSDIMNVVKNFMEVKEFWNIDTPLMNKVTFEGARDYLIPSRIHKGKFYALSQSPQLFKQLLMISGIDRYYQIAKCFRDEDLRSDRQPEFTQIDVEASFVTSSQICNLMEQLIQCLWYEITGINLKKFQKFTYSEVMRRFGSDKPDLRIPIEIVDVIDLLKNLKLEIFLKDINNNGRIALLKVPNGIQLIEEQIECYRKYVSVFGIKNFFWIKVCDVNCNIKNFDSPLSCLIPNVIMNDLASRSKACNGDLIFLVSGNFNIVTSALGALRVKIASDLNLIKSDQWFPLWVVDFPLFKKDSEGHITSMHHMFTAPKDNNIYDLVSNPLVAVANSYDMVINGYEVGSGSVRINCFDVQRVIFNILGINECEQYNRFGCLLDALKYGAPPHAGFAFGFDRLVMLLSKMSNIRDVIAFPKTTTSVDLMTGAPTIINSEILNELSIAVV